MIEAQIFINVASPEDDRAADAPYVIDGRRLQSASRLLIVLQELGWTATFAPHGLLDEGYVEWVATKRFADLTAAHAEVGTLDCVREVGSDVADPPVVMFDPVNEGRPPGPMYLRYTVGDRSPERWRFGQDPAGRFVDIPIPAHARRSIRVTVPDDDGDRRVLSSVDAVTVCEADGREVAYWPASHLASEPGKILAAIVACALAIDGPAADS